MQHLHAAASNNCTCTHVLRRLQTYQLCKICCVPALAMPPRSAYQNYQAWATYGTTDWWTRAFADPGTAAEAVAQRMHRAGLVCPAESTSADIAAGIALMTHGQQAPLLPAAECDDIFMAFKVRRMIMRASHHTSYIKHLYGGGHRDCGFCNKVNEHLCKLFCVHVRPIIISGAHQAACRGQRQGRRLHHPPPTFTSRLATPVPACSSRAFCRGQPPCRLPSPR